jgi:hypothetical protein
MSDESLSTLERHTYQLMHTAYFMWNLTKSPDALEREERIQKILEGDFFGKTLKFVFRNVPQLVSENAQQVKNLFFYHYRLPLLSLSLSTLERKLETVLVLLGLFQKIIQMQMKMKYQNQLPFHLIKSVKVIKNDWLFI